MLSGGGGGGAVNIRPAATDVTFYRQLLCKFQRTDEVVTANNGKFIADHVVTQVQEHDKSV